MRLRNQEDRHQPVHSDGVENMSRDQLEREVRELRIKLSQASGSKEDEADQVSAEKKPSKSGRDKNA